MASPLIHCENLHVEDSVTVDGIDYSMSIDLILGASCCWESGSSSSSI